ncbi:MAG TPA: DsbC family protein [Ramlibacter sp.]|nr:DsbC family protein [Ramlibacter sp.]
MNTIKRGLLAALAALSLAGGAQAQEAVIRKNLGERIPQLSNIDEISKTPMAGLFEVRIGTDLFYTDAQGNYLLHGSLIDTRAKKNLTEERTEKLSAVDFSALPTKDSFTIVRGDGKRKIALFQDPNCTYCKRFERDLQKVDNITITMYLYPILGPDSTVKARNIWCAKDKAKAWTDWMVRDQVPAEASCDTAAVARNVEFGRRYRITGTPTMIFVNGTRVPGAISVAQLEKHLAEAK